MRAGRSKKYAGMAIAAVGVAALVAGLGLSITAKSYSDELTNHALRSDAPGYSIRISRATERPSDLASFCASMIAIGGVGLVAGVVVAVLGFREGKRARLAATVGRSGLSVSF